MAWLLYFYDERLRESPVNQGSMLFRRITKHIDQSRSLSAVLCAANNDKRDKSPVKKRK
jgi:hypothetical protein